MIDFAYTAPALSESSGLLQWVEGDAFTAVQSSKYWTSTTYAGNTGLAWFVTLFNGYVNYVNKTNTHYVWPVRGGQ